MEDIIASNNSIRGKLLSPGELEELEYVNSDTKLQRNSTHLAAQIKRAVSTNANHNETLSLYKLLGQTVAMRALNAIKQDPAINVSKSDHSFAIDNNWSKWLDSGLRILKVYNELDGFSGVFQSGPLREQWALLKYGIFVQAAVFVLISPVLDLRKAKVLFDLEAASDAIIEEEEQQENSLLRGQIESAQSIFTVLQNIRSMQLVDYPVFKQFAQWLNREIYESDHHDEAKFSSLSFLQDIRPDVIQASIFQSIFEYNVYSLSFVYSSIDIDNFVNHNLKWKLVKRPAKSHAESLDDDVVSEAKVLVLLSNMINSKRLSATIDQAENVLFFEDEGADKSANNVLDDWQKWYLRNILRKTDEAFDKIQSVN